METGRTLRGATRLAFDAVESVTDIVESMYRNIAAAPLPFGKAPRGRARGIAGFVHQAIRTVNGGIREVSDAALRPFSDSLDRAYPPGPRREAAVAVLNGLCGDYLEATGNPLAIPLDLRLVPGDLAPTPRILVLAHGLCMNDRGWSWKGHNHAEVLADAFDYTPVCLRYNSGRHISTNGAELAAALERLIAEWPVPVESLTLVGFSMGGLVLRSAMHLAERQQQSWPGKVDRVVYIGTPHHGAPLERGGFWLHRSATLSPYTAPLAALGRLRSSGITDLRHGNLLDADRPIPLAAGIEHHAIAATLSERPSSKMGRLLGDGIVDPASATGRHADPQRDLCFEENRVRIVHGQSHLGMLGDPRVSECLLDWLRVDSRAP